MRIAVTSQNFKTITGHAGKTRRFLIYELDNAGQMREIDRLDLPAVMSLHEYQGEDHPLFRLGLTAWVTQGAGTGFVQRLARYGIQVHVTSESDPVQAVNRLAGGEPLAPGLPHEHDHGHDHPQGGGPHQAEARLLVQPR